MQALGLCPKVQVGADGSGVVWHAGARLLADLADATGLTAAHSAALRLLRPRRTGHDPGRIATDLVVMLAGGGGGHRRPLVQSADGQKVLTEVGFLKP